MAIQYAGVEMDEWRRWIAENLLLGCPPDYLLEKLVEGGMTRAMASSELQLAISSPYLAGADRLKNRLAKREWLLQAQTIMNRLRSTEVPRHHRMKPDDFLNDFYTAGRPVIISGMIDHWPAMQKWSLDYFQQSLGERTVEIVVAADGDGTTTLEKSRETIVFGDYIDRIRQAGKTNGFYMTANNDDCNRRALSELWRDIEPTPDYFDTGSPDDGSLWLGPAGVITPFHHDMTNNFMAQIMGRKRIRIVPAWEICNMYNHEHRYTHVDGRQLDADRFPLAQNVQMFECELNPGELLFVPVGAWHFVEGLEVTAMMSFINLRWDNHFMPYYPEDRLF